MNEAGNPPTDSFLRLAKSWLWPPMLALLCSFFIYGPEILLIFPILIWWAPLGIIGYFGKVNGDPATNLLFGFFHLVFWSLFACGMAGRFRLSIRVLRAIWTVLTIVLILTVKGCATHPMG